MTDIINFTHTFTFDEKEFKLVINRIGGRWTSYETVDGVHNGGCYGGVFRCLSEYLWDRIECMMYSYYQAGQGMRPQDAIHMVREHIKKQLAD